MRDWTIMLGGLIVWTVHFLMIYGFASIADVSDPAVETLWTAAGLGTTALGLGVLVWIAYRARRHSGLVRQLGFGGCTLSGAAIVLQSLPLLIAA